MGKKKQQQHVQQSMGQMVGRAALAQLGPQIEGLVSAYTSRAANQIAQQQASTLETLFARLVVLESIIMEKLGYTSEELVAKVADLEDSKEGYERSESVEIGDLARIEVSTRTKDQDEYQGSTRMKLYNAGSGQTIGPELEGAIVGMKAGETKELEFGKDNGMVAKITLDRASRAIKQAEEKSEEGQNGDSAETK